MAKRKASSSCSLFKIFKFLLSKRSHDEEMSETETWQKPLPRTHYNDDDGAEQEIDVKASAFINKFHETRVMDPEWQTSGKG